MDGLRVVVQHADLNNGQASLRLETHVTLGLSGKCFMQVGQGSSRFQMMGGAGGASRSPAATVSTSTHAAIGGTQYSIPARSVGYRRLSSLGGELTVRHQRRGLHSKCSQRRKGDQGTIWSMFLLAWSPYC